MNGICSRHPFPVSVDVIRSTDLGANIPRFKSQLFLSLAVTGS